MTIFKLFLLAVLVSNGGASGLYAAEKTFMPKNELHLQPYAPSMDKAEFDAVLDKVEAYYGPLIKEAFGATLRVNRFWSSETVNASASQSGKTWTINMYGGLARRVTDDGFLVVVCHELGHHLGGFSFYTQDPWAANEGQSDYFATVACVKNILRDEVEINEQAAAFIPAYPKALCDKAYEGYDERNLCYRVALAGKSTADLLAGPRYQVRFETPDRRQVSKTYEPHPVGQCRLDTYLNGALCNIEYDNFLIAGKDLTSSRRNSTIAERISAKASSCHSINGDTLGLRPRCWFAPKLK